MQSLPVLPEIRIDPAPGAPLRILVDHSRTGRSGHLGHALSQSLQGGILAFTANCSDDNKGHSAVGWMEIHRSQDGGQSWGAPEPLPLSRQVFAAGEAQSLFTEKAIVTDGGNLVLFHLVCDISATSVWEPYWVPLSTYSTDGGNSWSAPIPIGPERGRVYGATHANGTVYALKFANDATVHYCGVTPDHVYELYASTDEGQSFSRRSVLPLDTAGRGYGTICAGPEGELFVYVYDRNDEFNSECLISRDGGVSWSAPERVHFAKRLRNPQMIRFGGQYFMHGRSGNDGPEDQRGHFVLYRSADGRVWDQGTFLALRTEGAGAYSNSAVVRDPGTGRARLLIQASHAYRDHCTNIAHWWIDEA